MFNKLKFFVGSHAELTEWLHGQDYFVDEKRMKSFLKNTGNANHFGPFWLEKKENCGCFGEALGYPPDKAPTFPDTAMFEVKTEGFTQKEINEAFYKAYKHLDRQRNRNKRNEIKDFIIEKKSFVRKHERTD